MDALNVTGSVVLFESRAEQYEKAITSFLDGTRDALMWVVDNSPRPLRSDLFLHPRVRYIFSGRNLGFGAGHNLAISQLGERSDLHVILNPDVSFGSATLPYIVAEFLRDESMVAGMPTILYPDGTEQYLCKLLPTPLELVARRFLPSSSIRHWINRRYELRNLPRDKPTEVPMVSGCFLVTRSRVLSAMGGFDERFFMYMEDFDLVRRLSENGKIMYLPGAQVVHEYAKGSYRSWKLLGYHVSSATKYFRKWGWFVDSGRALRNRRALSDRA